MQNQRLQVIFEGAQVQKTLIKNQLTFSELHPHNITYRLSEEVFSPVLHPFLVQKFLYRKQRHHTVGHKPN